jgi:hypothetical protein
LNAGDFYRVHDGPGRFAFGRCRRHDEEWLVVETFGRFDTPLRYGWGPINHVVWYPYGLPGVRRNIERFLSYAEVWP